MPRNQTEEIITKFVWDTTGVAVGADKIKRAMADIKAAQGQGPAGTSKHVQGNDKNVLMALRDFAEGRTAYGLARLGTKFLAIGTAARLAYHHIKQAREELEKTEKGLRSTGDAMRANNAGLFQTRATPVSALGAELVRSQESQKEIREKLVEAGDERDMMKHPIKESMRRIGVVIPELGRRAGEAFDTAFNKLLTRNPDAGPRLHWQPDALLGDEGKNTAEMALKAERNREREARRKISDRLKIEKSIVAAVAPGGEGSAIEQARMELDLQEEAAIMEAKKLRLSIQDRDIISDKFDIMRKILENEDATTRARQQQQHLELNIAGGGAGAFAKGMQTATSKIQASRALSNKGMLTIEQERAEALMRHGEENARNMLLMGRYRNADGGKRGEGAIQAAFRNDRNATRRRNKFLRDVAAGKYDPVTGRRATAREVGLRTGGLATGGLMTGGLNGIFQEKKAVVKNLPPTEQLLQDIRDLMDKRLPKEQH